MYVTVPVERYIVVVAPSPVLIDPPELQCVQPQGPCGYEAGEAGPVCVDLAEAAERVDVFEYGAGIDEVCLDVLLFDDGPMLPALWDYQVAADVLDSYERVVIFFEFVCSELRCPVTPSSVRSFMVRRSCALRARKAAAEQSMAMQSLAKSGIFTMGRSVE